jgi:hypothetical protein
MEGEGGNEVTETRFLSDHYYVYTDYQINVDEVLKQDEAAILRPRSEQLAEKRARAFLQGLKPVESEHFMSELKLRPPKERTFSAACEDRGYSSL